MSIMLVKAIKLEFPDEQYIQVAKNESNRSKFWLEILHNDDQVNIDI